MMERVDAEAMKGEEVFSLALPPRPSSHRVARAALHDFLARRLRTAEIPFEATFFVAVGEALSNAIEHSGSAASIEIAAVVRPDRAVVWVRDRGAGFVASSPGLPDLDAERGRGLPLMRICSDGVEIASRPGVGTTVRLEQRLDRA